MNNTNGKNSGEPPAMGGVSATLDARRIQQSILPSNGAPASTAPASPEMCPAVGVISGHDEHDGNANTSPMAESAPRDGCKVAQTESTTNIVGNADIRNTSFVTEAQSEDFDECHNSPFHSSHLKTTDRTKDSMEASVKPSHLEGSPPPQKVLAESGSKKQALERTIRTPAASTMQGRRQHTLDHIAEEKTPEDGGEDIDHNFPLPEDHKGNEDGVDRGDAPALIATAGLTLPPVRATSIPLGERPPTTPGAFAIAGPGDSGTNEAELGREFQEEDGTEAYEDDELVIDGTPLNAFTVPNRGQRLINAAVRSVPPLVLAIKNNATRRQAKWGFFRKRRVQVFLFCAVLAAVGVAVGVAVALASSSSLPTVGPTSTSSQGNNESAQTLLPSLQPTTMPDDSIWEQIGSIIRGPSKLPGMTVKFLPPQGWPYYYYSHTRSNFTLSGYSVALSDNGKVLALGEPGVDIVRTFLWDNETEEWGPLGQDIIARPECIDEVYRESDVQTRNEPHDGGLLRRTRFLGGVHDPRRTAVWAGNDTVVLPCYMAFGQDVMLSGDGSVMSISAMGHNGSRGLIRSFHLEDKEGEEGDINKGKTTKWWVQRGQDIVGDAPRDIMGSFLHLSNDGRTLLAGASQGVRPDYAITMGMLPVSGRGYMRVFEWHEGDGGSSSTGVWKQRGQDISGRTEKSALGCCDISADKQSVVVGAKNEGYVEVYTWDSEADAWTLRRPTLEAPDELPFGFPVHFSSLDGRRIVVASQFHCYYSTITNANVVYVYEWDGESWERLDRLVVASGREHGLPCHSVVSPVGGMLSVTFSHGFLQFEWDGLRYVQRGEAQLAGGTGVATSEDGGIVAVGRPFDLSFGYGRGSTSVYRYIGGPINR